MSKLSNLWIFTYISQKELLQRRPKIRRICMRKIIWFSFDFISAVLIWFISYTSITEKQLLPPSHPWMVFHTNPRKFRHFWTVFTSFPYAFKDSNWLLWIKRRFEPYNAFKTVWKFPSLQGFIWKTTQAWLGGKSCFSLLIFGGYCDRYFWDIRLEIDRLPNFNMVFKFLLTIFEDANCFQEIRLLELIKWLPERKCFDLLSDSLNSFLKMYRDQYGELIRVYWGLKI